MTAKLIDSTNTMILESYRDREGELYIDGNARWAKRLSDRFHTSEIVGYELSNDIVTLRTLNSTYVFQLIDCQFDPTGIRSQKSNLVHHHDLMKRYKTKKWQCQIGGPGFLFGVMSTVTFVEPMTKEDAMQFVIENKITDDNEGQPIISLQSPYIEGEAFDSSIESKDWLCTVDNEAGGVSTITLPIAMNCTTAMQHIKENNLLDNNSGMPILELISPLSHLI